MLPFPSAKLVIQECVAQKLASEPKDAGGEGACRDGKVEIDPDPAEGTFTPALSQSSAIRS